MENDLAKEVLSEAIATFGDYKKYADSAVGQLKDSELFLTTSAESNCIAIIMKHIAGNFLSRWTDFLTTDGEKPDRNRDGEFELTEDFDAEALRTFWERGWSRLFESLNALTPEDFDRSVTIRSQSLTVYQALTRSLTHCAYHVGQIVFMAKQIRSEEWTSLSIPRKRSGAKEPQRGVAVGFRWANQSK